jgi:hypothetical protein
MRNILSIPITLLPIGNFRSLPAQIGLTSPPYPDSSPRPIEHPQTMSATVDVGFPPREPMNDSTLAIKYPLEPLSADQSEQE